MAPNVLERQFDAESPNQKWVTDVTEFNVRGEKLYLSPVLDLYNGEIVAYQMARRPLIDMVGTMLKKAFGRLKQSDKPILHSDQGWQYQMAVYRRLLANRSITQSMSRKGNCYDNAAVESFFGTLKAKFFYLNKFDNLDELEVGIQDYIRYYNHDRIKLKLQGVNPRKISDSIRSGVAIQPSNFLGVSPRHDGHERQRRGILAPLMEQVDHPFGVERLAHIGCETAAAVRNVSLDARYRCVRLWPDTSSKITDCMNRHANSRSLVSLMGMPVISPQRVSNRSWVAVW
jgi:hypothetical protein